MALGCVVMCVQGREVVVDVEDAPEVLEASFRVPERVALEVEEEIARRRFGQERESGSGLRPQDDRAIRMRVARLELQCSLLVNASPGVGADPGRDRLRGRETETRERR